jgi:hypothetical protein
VRTRPPARHYTVAQLPAGSYNLTISAPGFKQQFVRPGLAVAVAAIVRIDANLSELGFEGASKLRDRKSAHYRSSYAAIQN